MLSRAYLKSFLQLTSVFCGLLFATSAFAQVALQEIEFSALSGNRFEIEMVFSAAPPEPDVFEVVAPARLAMDFLEVTNEIEERRFPLSFDIADSVMVLESQGRTRVLVNLTDSTSYSSRTQGNRMFVTVGDEPSVSTAVAAQTGSQGAVARNRSSVSTGSDITNVDFRRSEGGVGQIIVGLANSNLTGSLGQAGNNLELEFQNADLAESLQMRLDVTDFGTPVQYIDVYTENDSVMVVADVEGEFEYIAYQGNEEYIINVNPVLADVAPVDGLANYDFSGDTISLDYPNIPIRSALQLLADFNNFNLVGGDAISGNTVLRLIDVPWDQALNLVLRAGGLAVRMEGNVMYVAPAEDIATEELRALESVRSVETLAPLVTEYIGINYAVASEIQAFLSGGEGEGGGGEDGDVGGGGFLSARGSSSVDVRTNTLIVQDVASVIAEVKEMLEKLDMPARQVLIEARIVNAETSFSRDLGVRWSGVQNFPGAGESFILGGNLASVTPAAGSAAQPSLLVDLDVSTPSSSFALGYAGNRGMLALELSALEGSGKGEVISQPSVTTQNLQLARIESGVQVPYQAQAGGTAGGSITEFVDALLYLEVTPQITPDGRIIMLLDIHQDSVVPTAGGGVPAISTNSVVTRVLVDDGETIVLGGIFREEAVTSTSKTLLLGDLPYVGGLFRNTQTTETKTELLIFITPSIIKEL